jgi:hypothetical protein
MADPQSLLDTDARPDALCYRNERRFESTRMSTAHFRVRLNAPPKRKSGAQRLSSSNDASPRNTHLDNSMSPHRAVFEVTKRQAAQKRKLPKTLLLFCVKRNSAAQPPPSDNGNEIRCWQNALHRMTTVHDAASVQRRT